MKIKSIDRKNHRVTAVVSTLDPDVDGEIVLPEAYKHGLELFFQNPMFLWDHELEGDPKYALGKVLSLEILPDRVVAVFQYNVNKNPFAKFVFDQVVEDTIRAYSVGFLPVAWETSPQPHLPERVNRALREGRAHTVYTAVALVEISQVKVGNNRFALIMAAKSLLKSRNFTLSTAEKTKENPIMEPEELIKIVAKSLGLKVSVEKEEPKDSPSVEVITKSVTEAVMAKVNESMATMKDEFEKSLNALIDEVLPAEKEDEEEASATE